MFLIPTKLIPTALTRLFSLPTKIRMGLELLHPPRPSGLPDESIAALVERHFGRETVDRLADPLLSGIFGGDSAQLSARTVLPRLVEMEEEYGSLTRGMLAAHRKMREAMRSARAARPARTARPANVKVTVPATRSIFTAMRGGMNQLVDAVAARLDPASVRLSTPVSGIEKVADGWKIVGGGKTEIYDAVIMASPAWAAGELLDRIDSQLAEELRGIPYSSSITVNLIYDEIQLGRLPDGFGFLVPVVEGRSMLACTFVHRKFLGRTPPDKAVLRAFLGGMKNEALMAAPDAELLATVRRELSEILGKKILPPDAEPLHTQVSRWPRAMAQYAVGHQERMKRIHASVAALPGLKLAGNAYDGIGIPDCIRLGRRAARELLASSR
jgi:oxygen-dependent protoporphyrinogen oxidase